MNIYLIIIIAIAIFALIIKIVMDKAPDSLFLKIVGIAFALIIPMSIIIGLIIRLLK